MPRWGRGRLLFLNILRWPCFVSINLLQWHISLIDFPYVETSLFFLIKPFWSWYIFKYISGFDLPIFYFGFLWRSSYVRRAENFPSSSCPCLVSFSRLYQPHYNIWGCFPHYSLFIYEESLEVESLPK